MDDVLTFDFSRDGFLENHYHLFLIDGTWCYHHHELDFRSEALTNHKTIFIDRAINADF
jgi:hypothetical protein